jgi:hypothetical protein
MAKLIGEFLHLVVANAPKTETLVLGRVQVKVWIITKSLNLYLRLVSYWLHVVSYYFYPKLKKLPLSAHSY